MKKTGVLLKVIAALWVLTAVTLAFFPNGALARYSAGAAGAASARVARFHPQWVKGDRMQSNGVLFSVPGHGSMAGWQMLGLHNDSEVAVEFNVWITVSDGGNDVLPEANGSKWTYYNLIRHEPANLSDNPLNIDYNAYGTDWTNPYSKDELTHMRANNNYSILPPNSNAAGNNDNKNLWTIRMAPGQYALLRITFNDAGHNGIQTAQLPDNNAIGGRCRLWYQAIQLD